MTTAENISFSPSLYFRYTYTILTLYLHYTYTIRTPKESRRAGAAEYVTKDSRKINVYKTSLPQKSILLPALSALLYLRVFPACHSKNP